MKLLLTLLIVAYFLNCSVCNPFNASTDVTSKTKEKIFFPYFNEILFNNKATFRQRWVLSSIIQSLLGIFP
jgi:hypothetical protein